jgi:hypothetical protein
MGSVIEYIECPYCKCENMYSEFWYKQNESMEFCDQCGYSTKISWKRDDNANLITIDGTKNYEFCNLILEEEVISQPYGSMRVTYQDGLGVQGGTLKDKEAYDKLVQAIAQRISDEGIESIIFSRFNKEKQQIEKNQLYPQK